MAMSLLGFAEGECLVDDSLFEILGVLLAEWKEILLPWHDGDGGWRDALPVTSNTGST
jgi:hypothetical protein